MSLTWTQRRALERELWLEGHLAALQDVRVEDLDDAAALRALETRALMLAETVAAVRRDRRDDAELELEVAVESAAVDVARG